MYRAKDYLENTRGIRSGLAPATGVSDDLVCSPDKTEVSGSSPEWPTKSAVREELSIRELLMMLPGEEGRRKMKKLTKTNNQLFPDYYDFITNTHS